MIERTARHYHVSHNIPGYLPESDVLTALDVRSALAILAEELNESADSIHESAGFADDDEARQLIEDEAERIAGMVDVLRWASTNPTDRFDLLGDGDVYRVEDVATGGLSVGIDHMPDSEHSLGLNFHLLPCEQGEDCELLDDEDREELAEDDALNESEAGNASLAFLLLALVPVAFVLTFVARLAGAFVGYGLA